jgi:hypothetical protein
MASQVLRMMQQLLSTRQPINIPSGSLKVMNLLGQIQLIHSTNAQYLSIENQLLYVVKTPSLIKLLPISVSV